MTSQGERFMPSTEFESKPSITIDLIANLGDLGLGNEINGIKSELAEATDAEKEAYGEVLVASIREVTDLSHYGCIDGRFCLHNADGSKPEVRLRQVGGTGLLYEVARNGGSNVIDALNNPDDLPSTINELDAYYRDVTGVERSAHLGGCGGVNGAEIDGDATATEPGVARTVEAIMDLDAVRQLTLLSYSKEEMDEIIREAPKTTAWLTEHGWSGQKYVDGVIKDEPAGVEDLEIDHDDAAHHGHKEPALLLIVNKGARRYSLSEEVLKNIGANSPFVINIDASYDMALAISDHDDEAKLTRLFQANLAKHASVAKRLPDVKTPVYVMTIS